MVFTLLFLVIGAWAAPPTTEKKIQIVPPIKQKQKRVEVKSSARFVSPSKEIIVQFKSTTINLKKSNGKNKVNNFAKKNGLMIKDMIASANAVVFTMKGTMSVADVMKHLKKNPDVTRVQENFYASLKNNIRSK